jgi:hypothetical protein
MIGGSGLTSVGPDGDGAGGGGWRGFRVGVGGGLLTTASGLAGGGGVGVGLLGSGSGRGEGGDVGRAWIMAQEGGGP